MPALQGESTVPYGRGPCLAAIERSLPASPQPGIATNSGLPDPRTSASVRCGAVQLLSVRTRGPRDAPTPLRTQGCEGDALTHPYVREARRTKSSLPYDEEPTASDEELTAERRRAHCQMTKGSLPVDEEITALSIATILLDDRNTACSPAGVVPAV